MSVMGPPSVTPAQMAQWFYVRHIERWCYRAHAGLEELCGYYLTEGEEEGVRGDGAFCQAIIETGAFCWPYPPGHPWPITPEMHNYAGLGATGHQMALCFPDARAGIRAQLQHLRAYATTEGPCDLHQPCVDPRFGFVQRGTAPTFGVMGFGRWAASTRTNPTYGESIVGLLRDLAAYRDSHPG